MRGNFLLDFIWVCLTIPQVILWRKVEFVSGSCLQDFLDDRIGNVQALIWNKILCSRKVLDQYTTYQKVFSLEKKTLTLTYIFTSVKKSWPYNTQMKKILAKKTSKKILYNFPWNDTVYQKSLRSDLQNCAWKRPNLLLPIWRQYDKLRKIIHSC